MVSTVITIGEQTTVIGQVASSDDASTHLAAAEQLASMLAPPEMIKGQMAGIVAAETANLRDDEEFAALEKKHPGVIDAVAFAVATELRQYGLERLPVLWKRLAAIYVVALTTAELRQAIDFYRSPSGAWLLDQIRANSGSAQLNKELLASGRDVTSSDLKSSTNAATTPLEAQMTPELRSDIALFIYSPVGVKLRELKPQLRQAQVDWSNERSPELAVKLKAVTAQTIEKFSNYAPKREGQR